MQSVSILKNKTPFALFQAIICIFTFDGFCSSDIVVLETNPVGPDL